MTSTHGFWYSVAERAICTVHVSKGREAKYMTILVLLTLAYHFLCIIICVLQLPVLQLGTSDTQSGIGVGPIVPSSLAKTNPTFSRRALVSAYPPCLRMQSTNINTFSSSFLSLSPILIRYRRGVIFTRCASLSFVPRNSTLRHQFSRTKTGCWILKQSVALPRSSGCLDTG